MKRMINQQAQPASATSKRQTSKLQMAVAWTLICACLIAPPASRLALSLPETSAELAETTSTRVTYYITPDYAEVWENGERVEIIKHYRVNGQKVATRDKEGLKFHVSDHLGSATQVTDAKGNQIKAYWYTPFGSDAKQSGTATVRYKYNDKEHDDTGFYHTFPTFFFHSQGIYWRQCFPPIWAYTCMSR